MKPELHAELEGHLAADQIRLYARRCVQLAERWKWFNPRPLSGGTAEALNIVTDSPRQQESDPTALSDLADQLTALKSQLGALMKIAMWGLVILAVLVLFRY